MTTTCIGNGQCEAKDVYSQTDRYKNGFRVVIGKIKRRHRKVLCRTCFTNVGWTSSIEPIGGGTWQQQQRSFLYSGYTLEVIHVTLQDATHGNCTRVTFLKREK